MSARIYRSIRPLLRILGLEPVFRLVALTYYQWAISEIHPLHPDVPDIVRRINELEHASA